MASCSQVNSFLQAHVDGELDPSEERILEAHLVGCRACREEVAAMESLQRDLSSACSMHRLHSSLADRVLAHLPEMDPVVIHGSHPTDPRLLPSRYGFRVPALAATVLLLLGAALLGVLLLSTSNSVPTDGAVGMVVYVEGPGTLRQAIGAEKFTPIGLESLLAPGDHLETLRDTKLSSALLKGTMMSMNEGSALSVTDDRRVFVERGQAFFDVVRDKRHFYVSTPSGEVMVFGTSFVVDVQPDSTRVFVVEGDVLVSTPAGRSALSAGKQSILRRGEAPTEPMDIVDHTLLAWLDSINPDHAALARFRDVLDSGHDGVALPAESVYAVRELDSHVVDGILLEWDVDQSAAGHCGYFVHVTDSNDNLLFLDTISGEQFDGAQGRTLEIMSPTGPITGVDVLHVRLIPDYSSGTVESVFEVSVLAHSTDLEDPAVPTPTAGS